MKAIKLLVTIFAIFALCFSLSAQEIETETKRAGSLSVLENDPTGIQWVFSLDEALKKARETDRIVMLKPISYRRPLEAGKFPPSSETQRATAFVDTRVVNLINRRFVPYYFNLENEGELYDPVATETAKRLHPELRFSTLPTPPLLLMTPEGKLLAQGSNFLDAEELLELLVNTLTDNPEYRELTTAELAIDDPVERAKILYELRDLDAASKMIEDESSSEAYYLKVLIAREKEDWSTMYKAIKQVTDSHRLHDIDVENIIRYWVIKNLDGIVAKGKSIKKDNPRFQEAMFYVGLAQYHLGKGNGLATNEETEQLWTDAIKHNPNSAWACRLDLALGLLKLGPGGYLSARDKIPTELGKRYMCPNGLKEFQDRR